VQILTDLEQADDIVNSLQSTPRGTLRVHTVVHMVPLAASVVPQFLSSYPEAKVDPQVGEAHVDLIGDGFNLALRMAPPPDSSLIVRNLATWRHVLCCSPGYLERHQGPGQLSDLANHNCIRTPCILSARSGISPTARACLYRCGREALCSRAVGEVPVSPRCSGWEFAWPPDFWGREDSNLQLDRYEREGKGRLC
jgi:DNA-binding transcriptional LysR family regulator